MARLGSTEFGASVDGDGIDTAQVILWQELMAGHVMMWQEVMAGHVGLEMMSWQVWMSRQDVGKRPRAG
ncbi:hypothetical protein ACFX12_025621 [Malus domestica]